MKFNHFIFIFFLLVNSLNISSVKPNFNNSKKQNYIPIEDYSGKIFLNSFPNGPFSIIRQNTRVIFKLSDLKNFPNERSNNNLISKLCLEIRFHNSFITGFDTNISSINIKSDDFVDEPLHDNYWYFAYNNYSSVAWLHGDEELTINNTTLKILMTTYVDSDVFTIPDSLLTNQASFLTMKILNDHPGMDYINNANITLNQVISSSSESFNFSLNFKDNNVIVYQNNIPELNILFNKDLIFYSVGTLAIFLDITYTKRTIKSIKNQNANLIKNARKLN